MGIFLFGTLKDACPAVSNVVRIPSACRAIRADVGRSFTGESLRPPGRPALRWGGEAAGVLSELNGD